MLMLSLRIMKEIIGIGSTGGGLYKINIDKKLFKNYRTEKVNLASYQQ